jgi:hypothetical protein
MKERSALVDLFLPWAGLVSGTLGAALTHQFGAEGMFDDCEVIAPVPLLLVALLGLAIVAAGAFGSWRVWRDEAEVQSRRLIAVISLGACAFFALAIILPMIATLVLPPCFQ